MISRAGLASAGTIALEISSRNTRVQALQNRWDRMRRVIDERATSPAFANVPGGTTGLLVKDYKGKDADQAGLHRAHERNRSTLGGLIVIE